MNESDLMDDLNEAGRIDEVDEADEADQVDEADEIGETGGSDGFEQAEGVNQLNMDIPDDLLYSEDHVWLDTSVSPAVLGITAYAAGQLGDLVYIDLPEPGDQVRAGDEVVELESSKAISHAIMPADGTIRYVNHAAADDPEVVNSDPYGEGWLLKIELDDEDPDLLDGDHYAKLISSGD